ncbi:MAG: C-terminal binding protein [Chloroflexota bacterium]
MAIVAILDCNFPGTAIEEGIVTRTGAEFRKGECATEDQVIELARDVDAIIVQYAPLTARVMDHLPRCRSMTRYGIGVDNVDVPAATERGIWVTNVPGFCAHEVAEHTLALVLSFVRRLRRLDRSVREGQWETIGLMRPTRRMAALTLGLIGFGQVARAVATSARGFGTRVIATAPRTTAETMADYGVAKVSLDDLLRESDFVSLHLPAGAQTRHLIDSRRLGLMKPSAYLLNTSRGTLVDEGALIEALQAGQIAGAGLDVLAKEPPTPDNPLLAMENVILTPHASYYSDDSLAFLQTAVAEETVRVLRGERPLNPVNPEVVPRAW